MSQIGSECAHPRNFYFDLGANWCNSLMWYKTKVTHAPPPHHPTAILTAVPRSQLLDLVFEFLTGASSFLADCVGRRRFRGPSADAHRTGSVYVGAVYGS